MTFGNRGQRTRQSPTNIARRQAVLFHKKRVFAEKRRKEKRGKSSSYLFLRLYMLYAISMERCIKKLVVFAFLCTLGSFLAAQQADGTVRGDFVLNGAMLMGYRGGEEKLTIPPNLGITAIGERAFARSNVKEIVIPERVTTIMKEAFAYSKVEIIHLPRSLQNIGERAFLGCVDLPYITLPRNLWSIGDQAFSGCTGLLRITLPPSVDQLGNGAFVNSGLTAITLSRNITVIEPNVFYGCADLTAITIPAGIVEIGDSAFFRTGLINVTIPQGMLEIGIAAFAECPALSSVDLPPSVRSIGARAFAGSTMLQDIRISVDTKEGYDAFEGVIGRPAYY